MKLVSLNMKTLLSICLVGFLTSCISFAQAEKPYEVSIFTGEELELCQKVSNVYDLAQAIDPNYCGLPIPVDDPDFKLPKWENLEPNSNMKLVRNMYYWHNLWNRHGKDLFEQQMLDKSDINEELLAKIWKPVEKQIHMLIQENIITLQKSHFDADFDGIAEDIYRMTPLVGLHNTIEDGHKVVIQDKCIDYGLPGADKKFIYYIPVAQLPNQDYGHLYQLKLRGGGYFFWKGRAYWNYGGLIREPYSKGIARTKSVCAIVTTKRITKND
jgi:hypothetical protein